MQPFFSHNLIELKDHEKYMPGVFKTLLYLISLGSILWILKRAMNM